MKNNQKFIFLLFIEILIFSGFVSWVAAKRYETFILNHDFALSLQGIHNTLKGKVMYSSLFEGSFFKEHLSLIFVPISIPFLIFPSPYTLIFLQNVFIASAAIPIFYISKFKFQDDKIALIFSLIYLSYPFLSNTLINTSPISFSLPFLFSMIYFFEKNNFRNFALFSMLSIICREDVAILVSLMGIYALVKKRNKLWISVPLILGIFWLFLTIYANPIKGGVYPHLFEFSFNSISDDTLNKIQFLYLILLPILFFSIFDKIFYLLGSVGAGKALLSVKGISIYYWIYGSHTFILLPAVFVGLVYSINNLRNKFNISKNSIKILLVIILLWSISQHFLFQPKSKLYESITSEIPSNQDKKQIKEYFISLIPRNSSVCSQGLFLSHLTNLKNIYPCDLYSQFLYTNSTKKVDYVLLDLNVTSISEKEKFEETFKSNDWIIVERSDYLVLAKNIN